MQTLPIQAVPSQNFSALLDGQQTAFSIYTLGDNKLYMDVSLNNRPVVTGVLLCNNNKIIRNTYLGYVGDFIIYDTQGVSDPTYDGLGVRYLLFYLTADEANNG